MPDDVNDVNARIKVVYPKSDQIVGAVDSTFILGNVPAGSNQLTYRLFINDRYVPTHPDGGFIAFVPVTPGEFEFRLNAFLEHRERSTFLEPGTNISEYPTIHARRSLTETVKVTIPEPMVPLLLDTTIFDREYAPPSGDLVLQSGDRLKVMFRGTPMRSAWFSIEGVVDSVPMAETTPRNQAYWGESVFGAGAVPESLKVEGIYSGFYDIPTSAQCDSVHIKYSLGPLPHHELYNLAIKRNWMIIMSSDYYGPLKPYGWGDTAQVDTFSSFAVTINDPEYPFTVRFTDSVQIIRHAPYKGYFSIFQPEGVEALAVGAEGEWYKIQLSKTQNAWANKQAVERLPYGVLPPSSYLSVIRFSDHKEHLLLE
ncbi:MAG: hypothetical protein V3T31_13155, partial [candidate division Zixibacteria bacterium]